MKNEKEKNISDYINETVLQRQVVKNTYSVKLRIITFSGGTVISLTHSLLSGYVLGKFGEAMIPLVLVKFPPQFPVINDR